MRNYKFSIHSIKKIKQSHLAKNNYVNPNNRWIDGQWKVFEKQNVTF